ncbi:Protein kinase-like protein [Quillaja saponaria]|uniref:Protein kinase-like protein n=1 Tax=Quillaja saponaria TaxID=32244 RepID=A0AAD7KSK7_QUISA|nr:Protein kinase-like protein [Quillaja saponaria]
MEWVRGDQVGRGSFATVNLAIPRKSFVQIPPLTVVKSSISSNSASLKNEKQVLDRLGDCQQVIRCFGDDHSFENGEELYNLILEYATGGSLADQLKYHGGRLSESDVRLYTKSILKGLGHIHAQGFVHCDLKLQNILLFDNGEIKIADFGLAKKTEEKQSKGESEFQWRGTPLYMSPESVKDNKYDHPADIWALGCAVVEMVTGKPVWNLQPETNICSLLLRIGVGEELPDIPAELSEEARDFLEKCFVKDPRNRWTAEKLLNHPFVADVNVSLKHADELLTSPRSHFDFPEWVSTASTSIPSSPESEEWFDRKLDLFFDSLSSLCSPEDRLRQLITDQTPNWSVSESWISVR